MTTREEALAYGLSFDNVYEEKPFHDPNWQLVRVRGSKKAFLWIYERNGFINLNVKVAPEWRDFWRSAYDSVIAGYHQNKDRGYESGHAYLQECVEQEYVQQIVHQMAQSESCGFLGRRRTAEGDVRCKEEVAHQAR